MSLNNSTVVAAVLGVVIGILIFANDFYQANFTDSETVSASRWYPNDSLLHPYLNFKAHWSKDAALVVTQDGGGGIWLTREIKIGKLTFWTRIEPIDRIDFKDYQYTNANSIHIYFTQKDP